MTIKLVGADDASGLNESANYFILDKFTAVASGNMTEFRVKSAVGGYVKCALYADNGGEPGALIIAMNTGQAVLGGGWEALSFTPTPITQGTVYWLAININTDGATQFVGSGGITKYRVATYSSFTFPNPAGTGFSSNQGCDLLAGWGVQGQVHEASALLSGGGSLSASASLICIGSATLAGIGMLTAVGTVIGAVIYGSATLSGTGTLSASGVRIVVASATLSGVGSLTAAGQIFGFLASLYAAQKKAHRLPYVEAKVYDYEQGIKRLTWTRLYEGEEPDNHHGIAIDGEGSMHRIRAAADDKLYYQKVTSPDDESDYSQWMEIATDCAGPCAIAAYGAKVYVFYRKTDDTLRRYYSHNYGTDWTNAELADYADVLSLAACWWATGDVVVCFALTSNELNGITLDSSDQTTSQHIFEFHGAATHIFQDTYGIGATFNDFWPAIEIILAAKEYDAETEIVTYSLYATKFSNTYHFSAVRVLLTAYDDVLTSFKYPDCHLPAEVLTQEGQPYETTQLTVVEDFSGVTAYTYPLSAHMVKGTDWSSGIITEPKPFVDISADYGLRLQTTAGYWWMERPDGVWRAPRPASPPIVLTSADDIVQLRQVIGHQRPGSLVIVLDNSRAQYTPIPSGLRFRSEIQLRLGYKTPDGDLALESLTYWVDRWQYSTTQQAQSTLTLFCLDLWGLASAWSARYALRWNYTAVQPARVWEILYQLLGRFGIRLWNNPVAPKSDAIDDYYPKFISRGGTHADTQLRRLLSFVIDVLVPREAICFAKDLLSSEDSSYEYKNEPGAHRILEGVYGESTPTTHAQVSGDTEDEPPVRVREAAFDWELLALGIEKLIMQYDANLEEAEQAEKRADALLRHEFLESMGDHIIVPTNVGQELYDVITVTDARCGIDQEKYRVLAIQTDYDRRKGQYDQRLTLGAL